MNSRIFMVIGFLFTIVACTDPHYPLHQLEGKWYCKTENGNWVSETWERHSDDLMKGVGKEISGEQETVTEYLELKRMGDALIYSATVPTQNEGNPVEFTCDSVSVNMMRFVNPNHDFPKFITYQLVNPTHMTVTVGNDATNHFVLEFSKDKE
ncbi:MAG: hypothetical protein K1X54_07150 [Flavobacteriales bacterium]|nr:hypothetical protein [Flavobacteriales bacterium]